MPLIYRDEPTKRAMTTNNVDLDQIVYVMRAIYASARYHEFCAAVLSMDIMCMSVNGQLLDLPAGDTYLEYLETIRTEQLIDRMHGQLCAYKDSRDRALARLLARRLEDK